jgi:hypothetical protein
VHCVRVQMQTPDDFCLSFPCLRKLMHLLMHRRLPSTPRTRGRGFTSRGLAELPIRVDRLRWSKGRLLGVLFHLLACLTEHLDLLRQRFLDHFSQIFEHMPTIEDAVRACGAPLGAAFR